MGRYLQSKLKKTNVLLKNETLREHIPETKKMSESSLEKMLQTYRMVYIKPDIGTYGEGVMRVEWIEDKEDPYIFQSGKRKRSFRHYSEMYSAIVKKTRKKRYLVQRGIHLLKYRGNRFDLRLMVQKTPAKKWVPTGIIGRVAQPGKVVTNFHNGGKLVAVEQLISPYMTKSEVQLCIKSLKRLGRQVASQLHSKYPGLQELGLDIALDKELKPWLLEVNTAPDPYIFRHLKDKRIFARVISYHSRNLLQDKT